MRAADVRAEEMDTAPPTRGGNGDAGKKYVEEALYLRLFRRGSTPQAVRLQLGGRRLHPPATAPGALPSGTQGGVTFRLGEPFLEKELAVQQAAKNPAPLAVCRKCIYKKFDDEEVESCPVCEIDLGCTPVEKLRADHSLQDVRSKIFPLKRKKIKAGDAESPISPPNKRKERSISSLVVHTPRLTPTGSTGRRTRAVTRKSAAASRGLGSTHDNPVKKETDQIDKNAHSSSLPANVAKVPKTRRQILSNGEASNHSSNKDTEDDSKDMADNAELWRPLNCLVEAANRTKSFRSSLQSSAIKREQLNGSPSSTNGNKTNPKEHLKKPKMEDDKKDAPLTPVRLNKKLQGTGRRRRGLRAPADVNPDGALTQKEKRFSSIWFSLVASFEQKGDTPLPQIPSQYLRIKDANIPASSIQKYLVQKLSLPSESEVEINCCGQQVDPTQPLRNLVELWLKGRSTQATQATVGSPAEDFVMVLTYGRPKAMAT